MEAGGEQEHLNEADSPESAGGDDAGLSTGSGRFYECVFCKRGFSTAQALGGHMNIHRKDRSKIRPAARLSPPAPKRVSDEGYHPYSRSEQRLPQPQAVQSTSSNYSVYFPAGSSSSAAGSRDRSELVLAGEELQLGLGEPSGGGGPEKDVEAGAEDLDLELRLGRSRSSETSDT